MNRTIIFILNNFNVGGPQKSLLSLLYNLPKNFKVDLLVLNNESTLSKYLPENVNLLPADKEYPLLMLNKNGILKSILVNLFSNFKLSKSAIIFLFKNLFNRNLVKKKQRFWIENKDKVKRKLVQEYDFAIGVSGGHSIMYVVDFVNAKNKVGWVRTEYQNLKRDLHADLQYFQQLNLILSVSNKCTNKFIDTFPSQAKKIQTFYNPLPYKMYEYLFETREKNQAVCDEKNIVNITTISRLDKDKGFDLAIEAARMLKDNNYNYVWNIYGDGPEKNKIYKSIKKNNLVNYVKLKGFVFNTGGVLKNTNILVHPSRFEGKSNTIDEAKFYEVPIVATKYPTVSEQLANGVNSIITDMNSISLYKGISTMITDKQLRYQLSANLKENKELRKNVFNEFMDVLEMGIAND